MSSLTPSSTTSLNTAPFESAAITPDTPFKHHGLSRQNGLALIGYGLYLSERLTWRGRCWD